MATYEKAHIDEIASRQWPHWIPVRHHFGIETFGITLWRGRDDGTIVDVRRRDINAYIRELAGQPFTAKDFRTWAGTLLCCVRLGNRVLKEPVSARQRKRCVAEELREVAAALGNTPAVCRESYVSPAVIRTFEAGRLTTRAPLRMTRT